MSKARQDNLILFHMAALLFSLAEMALHANYLPFAQRLVLLTVMRRGDAAARKIAIRAGSGAAYIVPTEHDVPDASLRLAIGFQMLALALQTIALRQQAMLDLTDDECSPRPTQLQAPACNGSLYRPIPVSRPFPRDGPFR